MNETTPRWKTKSFWLALGTFIISGLAVTGVISLDNQDTITQVAFQVISAITAVGAIGREAYVGYKSKKECNNQEEDNNKLPTRPPRRKTRRRTR